MFRKYNVRGIGGTNGPHRLWTLRHLNKQMNGRYVNYFQLACCKEDCWIVLLHIQLLFTAHVFTTITIYKIFASTFYNTPVFRLLVCFVTHTVVVYCSCVYNNYNLHDYSLQRFIIRRSLDCWFVLLHIQLLFIALVFTTITIYTICASTFYNTPVFKLFTHTTPPILWFFSR